MCRGPGEHSSHSVSEGEGYLCLTTSPLALLALAFVEELDPFLILSS